MKIFLSYGHNSNAPLVEKIKEYLTKDAKGNLRQIELRAELPNDMREKYHFGEI